MLTDVAFLTFKPLVHFVITTLVILFPGYDVAVHMRNALAGCFSVLHSNVEGICVVQSAQGVSYSVDSPEEIVEFIMGEICESWLDIDRADEYMTRE